MPVEVSRKRALALSIERCEPLVSSETKELELSGAEVTKENCMISAGIKEYFIKRFISFMLVPPSKVSMLAPGEFNQCAPGEFNQNSAE